MTNTQLVYSVTTGKPKQDYRFVELAEKLASYVGGYAANGVIDDGRTQYDGEIKSISVEGDLLRIDVGWFRLFIMEIESFREVTELGSGVLAVYGSSYADGVILYPR